MKSPLTNLFRKSLPPTLRLALAATALAATAFAQTARTASTPEPSRLDLYGGYGYFHPVDSDINNFQYQPINPGAVVSVSGYFNRYLGIQAEGSFFPHGPNDCVSTAQAGPIARLQHGRFVPFAHVLAGGARVGGPAFQACTWGIGATGGLGFDYIVSGFGNHVAIRPIQADYEYSHVNYGPLVVPAGVSGGIGEINAYRLSAGLVLRFGSVVPPAPVQLSCSIQPADVFPGDPVTVSATTANLKHEQTAVYHWSTSGGKIGGTEPHSTIASIDTTNLAPGDYTVSGHVSEGAHAAQQASCTAAFHVREIQPPTISCSANPSTVMPGDSSTITAVGNSPQNRPLSYTYSASSGEISAGDNSMTVNLASGGTAPGAITVTCNVVDDLGKRASATTSVIVASPPARVAPAAQNLCSLSFERDRKRPTRVDNEAKGCLDDVSLTLNRDPAAKLVLTGSYIDGETQQAAEQRALNVRQYLTDERGIDASRIELRTVQGNVRTVTDTLVPAGSSFDPPGSNTFDPASVQRGGQPYGSHRPSAR